MVSDEPPTAQPRFAAELFRILDNSLLRLPPARKHEEEKLENPSKLYSCEMIRGRKS
jgi:hypothetical protein